MTSTHVKHGPNALGYRIDAGGKSVTISGDIAEAAEATRPGPVRYVAGFPCESIERLAQGTDVFIIDACPKHNAPEKLAAAAVRANRKKVVLTQVQGPVHNERSVALKERNNLSFLLLRSFRACRSRWTTRSQGVANWADLLGSFGAAGWPHRWFDAQENLMAQSSLSSPTFRQARQGDRNSRGWFRGRRLNNRVVKHPLELRYRILLFLEQRLSR